MTIPIIIDPVTPLYQLWLIPLGGVALIAVFSFLAVNFKKFAKDWAPPLITLSVVVVLVGLIMSPLEIDRNVRVETSDRIVAEMENLGYTEVVKDYRETNFVANKGGQYVTGNVFHLEDESYILVEDER